jgi:hypothetical protein
MMISIDFKFKSEPPSPPAEINEYTKYLPKHRWLRYVASKNDPNSVVEDG